MSAGDALPLSAHDYEGLGRAALSPALADYVSGGADDEWTLRDNRAALERWSLCPRVMRGIDRVDTAVTVVGTCLSMPLLVAPLAYLGLVAPGAEIALARATRAQGTVMCLSTFATVSPAELVSGSCRSAFWHQVYLLRDRGLTNVLIERAVDAGASALIVTVDAPRIGRRERDIRRGFSIPPNTPVPALDGLRSDGIELSPSEMFALVDPAPGWSRIEEICALTDLPVLVKGVLSGRDARAACECGAAGVVVSNHGGRQLDGARAGLDALPEVVEAVGAGTSVLVDGGFRRGTDVVKAIALGAEAALIGRPAFWALAAGGEAGVEHLLALLRDEMELALALLGCRHPHEIDSEHVRRVPGAG